MIAKIPLIDHSSIQGVVLVFISFKGVIASYATRIRWT